MNETVADIIKEMLEQADKIEHAKSTRPSSFRKWR